MKESKEDLLYLAKLAEQAERYDGKLIPYIPPIYTNFLSVSLNYDIMHY